MELRLQSKQKRLLNLLNQSMDLLFKSVDLFVSIKSEHWYRYEAHFPGKLYIPGTLT